MDFRPNIRSITDGAGLRKWYWRKAELVDRARELHLKTTASKFELLDRIAHFLGTGTAIEQPQKRKSFKSKFNWHFSNHTLVMHLNSTSSLWNGCAKTLGQH